MNDRAYELKLTEFEPYWPELLGAWVCSILLLALIEVTLILLRKPKPGEFAKLLGLIPTLILMVLPAVAGFYFALKAEREYGMLAAMAAFIGGPVLAIFAASKLKRLFVWLFTGFGQFRARWEKPNAPPNPDTTAGPTLNGKAISILNKRNRTPRPPFKKH